MRPPSKFFDRFFQFIADFAKLGRIYRVNEELFTVDDCYTVVYTAAKCQ